MPNTNKVSKYLFDQVEARLDAIKLDGAGDKYLADDGQYKEIQIPNSDAKIGDLNTLTTNAKDSVVNAVNELKTSIDNVSANGYDDKPVRDSIGELNTLKTTEKTNLVGAINEVHDEMDGKANSADVYPKTESDNKYQTKLTGTQNQVVGFDAGGNAIAVNAPESGVASFNGRKGVVVPVDGDYTAEMVGAKVTIEESTQNPDYAKTYTIKQNNAVLSTINIPKDMVVSAANVVTDPQNQPAGKYVELTIANATNDKIYLNIADLVDAYTVQQSATQVQLAISPTNEISASIVASSITSTELADNSVVTSKIVDGNVTKAKLNQDVLDLFYAKQDKITGKQGQTVGFDANGNVVAEGTPVTKDQFTFVVNNSQTFNEWIGNDVTNGGDATKYESVYIAKGNYTASNTTTQTNGIYYAINLTKTGTKKIYAESSAKITFVGAYHNNDVVGVGYEQIPRDTENYSVHGLTVRAQVDGVNENGYRVVCFYNMVNVTECIAESNCNTKTDGGVRVEGFKNCDSLSRCKATDFVAGFTDGVQPTKKLSSIGFSYCVDLLECESYPSVKENTTATNDVNGYENCVNMVRCIGNSNEKYVVVCIAGQSNAVGYDESPIDNGGKLIYTSRNTNRIKQLGFYGDDNLKIIDLGYCAQSMQDMRPNNRPGTVAPGTKGIHLPLANLMLDYIPEDYNILVLPIAYGGTGFTSGNNGTYSGELKKPTDADPKANQGGQGTAILKWGTGTAYYQTLRDRIIHALELNDNNMFAGIIWCQGENDMNNANGHKSGFEAMTQMLFDELNAHNNGALKARTPRGTFDRNIWYNMETVGYWYNQGQCQTIWDNYRTWNEATYVEIPRDTESNDVNGTGATAGVRAKHYGNNAYQKVVAPRVLQKMIDMDTFTKKVNVVEKEIEIPIVTPEITPEAKTHEDERLIADSDVTRRSQGTVLTIDANGNCTANKELRNSYATDKTHIIFKDFYKMEFKVSRSMYWLVIEQDTDADSVVVVGFGKGYTTRTVQITKGTISQTPIKEADSSKNKTFHKGHRIRIYRETNGNIVIYEKGNSGIWYKWLEISSPNVLKEKVLGFCVGIAGNEFSDSFATDDMKLFEDMTIWQASPSSTTREIDMRLTSIERPYDKYKEERDAVSSDIVSQSSGSTFSLNGSKNIVASATIDTTKVQKVYLKDVFKLEFNVNRAIYYLVLRKNSANDDVLVCEIGGANTGRISTINTANQKTVLVNSAIQHTLQSADKIRVYRDGNGSVHVYLKKQSTTWTKVATVSERHEFDKQLFGFVVGLGTDETNSSIGVSDTLLSSLKVWETEPFPLARVFDIRTSN